MTNSEDDQALLAQAETRVRVREGFRIHLFVYVLVNALLWSIWLVNGASLAAPWPIFPLLGWGIGLASHWYAASGLNEARRAEAIDREVRRLRSDGDK